MRQVCRAYLIGSLALTVVAWLAPSAMASQRNVPSSYATIQAAVNASYNTGDEVVIAPGTYTGSGNRDIDFGGRKITVRSTDPSNPAIVAQTIIDCGGSELEPHRAFMFHKSETSSCVVAGLTIINGYSRSETWAGQTTDSGGAIYIESASPVIRDCTIESCQATGFGGAIYSRGGSPSILRCSFRNCGGTGVTGGAIFAEGGGIDINNCVFAGNSAQVGGAVAFAAGYPDVADCTFEGNAAQAGGAVDGATGDRSS